MTSHKRSDGPTAAMPGPVAAARPVTRPPQSRGGPGGQPVAPAAAPDPAAAGVRRCGCAEELRRLYAGRGVEATVTHVRPIFASPYEQLGMLCPHGVHWYTEPTREQILRWQRDGVK